MNGIVARRLLAIALGAALIANAGGAHAGAPQGVIQVVARVTCRLLYNRIATITDTEETR